MIPRHSDIWHESNCASAAAHSSAGSTALCGSGFIICTSLGPCAGHVYTFQCILAADCGSSTGSLDQCRTHRDLGCGTLGVLTGQSYTPTGPAEDNRDRKRASKGHGAGHFELSRRLVEEVSMATSFSHHLVTVKLARNGRSHSLKFDSLVLHHRLVVQAQCELRASCWQAA